MNFLRRAVLVTLAAGFAGGGLLWALQPPSIPVPASRSGVFHGLTILEPGEPPRTNVTIRIEDGLIASIEPTSGDSGDGDFAGRIAVPGLIDMHVHYPPRVAIGNTELWSLLLLSHGVTSIRETGSIDGSVFSVRADIREGRTPGPRIFACGPMLDGSPPSFPSNRIVQSAAEAREAVAELADQGADCLKAYNMLSREALAGLRAAATEKDLPLIGHAPHAVSLDEAGLADLQHGTGVVLVDHAKIGRSDFRSEDWQTVDAARIAYAAHVSLEQGIAHTPTLVNARMRRWLLPGESGSARIASDSGLRHLPSFWRDAWSLIWAPPYRPDDLEAERLHQEFRERQAAMTVGLHRAGVRVHAGTDTLMPYVAPGSSLHGELRELELAGIPREDVWSIATREAGDSLRKSALGRLVVGAPADILLLRPDARPHQDLDVLSQPEAVIADGRLYRRTDLDRALSRFDAHFHGPLYRTAMDLIIAMVGGNFAPEAPVDARHTTTNPEPSPHAESTVSSAPASRANPSPLREGQGAAAG